MILVHGMIVHPASRTTVFVFLQINFWETSYAPKSRNLEEKEMAHLCRTPRKLKEKEMAHLCRTPRPPPSGCVCHLSQNISLLGLGEGGGV